MKFVFLVALLVYVQGDGVANDDIEDVDLDVFHPPAAEYDPFDLALTKIVAKYSKENVLLSPMGLKIAMAILTEGATGSTGDEIKSVLGLDLDRQNIRKKFSSIIKSLKKESPEYILTLSSRIYVADSSTPRARFAAIAKEFYNTELMTIDFSNLDKAVTEINTWVNNITQGKISTLVVDDDIIGAVMLVLNALYFKGTWRHQFPPKDSRREKFYVTPGNGKFMPFMNIRNRFYYTESKSFDAKILRLPYRGNKFAMYIIVPNSLDGLPRALNGLKDLRTELNNLSEYQVDVKIPKIRFEYTSRLDGILKELGVCTAFNDTASFPGIVRYTSLEHRLKLSKILQRAGIEMNELGSIAYFVTEIGVDNKFADDTEVKEVIVNKPFLFFIQDEETQNLLFIGRVSDPSLKFGALRFS